MSIIIDEEFKDLIAPLTEEEYKSLESNLLENGFNPAYPVIIWKGHDILVDGHNRYGICQKFGIEPDVIEQEFNSREDVINWMIENQLSRRSIDLDTRAYLIGRKYTTEKKPQGGARGNSCTLSTDERLAKEFNVSPRTVKTDGKFFEAVERICKLCGIGRQELMLKQTKKDILDLDKLTDAAIIETWHKLVNGDVEKKKAEGIFPIYLKLDKSTNAKLKYLSKSKSPQDLLIELINAEWERRSRDATV